MKRPLAATKLKNFTLNICSFQAQLKIRFCCTSIKYRFRENETMMITSAGSRCAEGGSCWPKKHGHYRIPQGKKDTRAKTRSLRFVRPKWQGATLDTQKTAIARKQVAFLAKIESPVTSSPYHIFLYFR